MDILFILYIFSLSIIGIYTLCFIVTNDFMKWYLKAKLTGAKSIVVNLNPNGTLEIFGLIRKDGTMWTAKGTIVQDYERILEDNKEELITTAYYFGSIRFIFLMDGEIASLNKQGKPASLDMPYFNRLRNLEKIRIDKRNKLIQHKARPMSVFFIIMIGVIGIIGILALKKFIMPMIGKLV